MQRDETALEALYDRYAGMLSSVLNRILRDTQAAEEILQDIFYQLWRTASRFDASRGSLPGWLMVIARNRAISRLRQHNPAAGEELLENTAALAVQYRERRVAAATLGRVKGALENLAAPSSAPPSSSHISRGSRTAKSPQRTGDPLGTVKTRLRSALETLRRNFAYSCQRGKRERPSNSRRRFRSLALGALEGDERQAIESHVATCASCARKLAEAQGRIALLALAAPPVKPSAVR